ncbi:MAG: hypothetical protein J6S43_04515 [Lentisphaeria bacterium]|nr:hypothetical protein [Lentisphaeria bacterium]
MDNSKNAAVPVKIELIDDFTGRIALTPAQFRKQISGKWQLEIDGVRHSFGQFLLRELPPGEPREILLSVEVPDAVFNAEAILIIRLFDENDLPITTAGFSMPVPAHLPPAAPAAEYITGVRFDLSQAIISSGKLSATINADGIRELYYNGEKLLTCGPRLSLYRAGKTAGTLHSLQLDRLRISPDRFVSDGQSVESHALVLPSRMELDELEFTQKFTPQNDGSIRYDAQFVVPESFSGIPRLGVVMRLPGNMEKVSCFGRQPVNSELPGAIKTLSHTTVSEVSRQYLDGGYYQEVKFVALGDETGKQQLKIFSTGTPFSFTVMKFSENSIADAAAAGKELPAEESEVYLYIDCRNGDSQAVKAGVCRMTLFFTI